MTALDGAGVRSVLIVAGARPNFVKVAPVLRALEATAIEVVLVHTGQHYDANMSDSIFQDLGIREPDHHLRVGSGSFALQTGKVMAGLEPLLVRHRPDVAMVVGDVNSTVAAALAAAQSGALVAHIESGLRSRDWTMPEEVNRVVTDRISDLLYAPSPDAADNLRAEGTSEHRIAVVGNVVVDALLDVVRRGGTDGRLERFGLAPGDYALVTLHRPALVDHPEKLDEVVGALDQLARRMPVIWPIHPRTDGRLVRRPRHVTLVPPTGYLDFVALERSARVVITDSGGVQEETTALGVACLTLRDHTERPITLVEGTNTLIGERPNRLLEAVEAELEHPTAPRCPALWDGRASDRLVAHLAAVTPGTWPRPTDLGLPLEVGEGAGRGGP